MTTDVLLEHVRSYATAVRAHLADLPPEQVEDLTDGLEADLAEALDDAAVVVAGAPGPPDLTRRFGSAQAYAMELRSAAGLGDPPGSSTRRKSRAGVLRSRWTELVAQVEASPAGPAVFRVRPSLPPLWWVLRGWVWFAVVHAVMGTVFGTVQGSVFVPQRGGWLLLIVSVAGSFLAGALPRRGAREGRLLRAASVVAAVLVVPLTIGLVADLGNLVRAATAQPVQPQPSNGVWIEGDPVVNLYGYDADGQPLDAVQLFDDRGRPVLVGEPEPWAAYLASMEEDWVFGPARGTGGRELWNVFPLAGKPAAEWEWGPDGLVLDGTATTPPPPFARASPVERTPDGGSRPEERDPAVPGPAPTGPAATVSPSAAPAPSEADAAGSGTADGQELAPADGSAAPVTP